MTVFGARQGAVDKGHPQQPVIERRYCCPNPECGRDDNLQIIEQGQVTTPAVITDVGTSWPEVNPDVAEEVVSAAPRTLIGFRCGACRQSYVGPDPLGWPRLPA